MPVVTTNYERAFAERPDVYAAWGELLGAIKANMDLRRYELATLAAARRLRSSYCSLAHGKVLLEQFGEPVVEIATDRDSAGLDAVDLAVMDLAERVVDDATTITDAHLQRLRDLGLTDAEIMDVVLTAAVRSFWTKTLDSLGVQPDASYAELDARAPRGARRGPPDRRGMTPTAPTLQLLAWIAERPRSYAETIETWKTSCPRLSVWEDALADDLVRVERGRVSLTPAGAERVERSVTS